MESVDYIRYDVYDVAENNGFVSNVNQPIKGLLEDQQHMDSSALYDKTTEKIRRVRNHVRCLQTHVKNLASDPSQIRKINQVQTYVFRRIETYRRNVENAL